MQPNSVNASHELLASSELIIAAVRDLRQRALKMANVPSPSVPRIPETPRPDEPRRPEQPEPTRYPIHPEIPKQPIHEPIQEPSHTPVEGP